MSYPRLFASFLTLLLLAIGIAPMTSAQERAQPPSQRHSSARALQSVERQSLPPVDTETLRAEDKRQADAIGPYRYGTIINTDFTPTRHGTWEQLPSGRWLWRLRIESEDAVSLSLNFSQFKLPDGASLFVYDPEGNLVRGPYTQTDATKGEHWTPLVRGDEIVVEVEVPADRRSSLNLVTGKVVHGYRGLSQDRNAPASKAGSCNVDVACDESLPWRQQVRSVGRYTFEQGGFASVCTGSLVNNTAEDKTPYFLTAEHCVSSQDVAESMVFYWNYQNPTCRDRGTIANGQVTNDDLNSQITSSGALLRFRYGGTHDTGSISGKPDLALVEIDDDIPDSYELYFSGWSREGNATTESVTIHHPQGHGKRISFDEDPSSITAYAENNGGSTHLRIGDWETGTTEAGSSGSPLFDSNQRIVGVLSGGLAGCGVGGVDDNNQPDWYGRLAPGFTNGDYTPPGDSEPTTLADVLDPNNTGIQTLEGRNLGSFPPGEVSNFRVASATPDSATLQWTASGDDGDEGTAFAYDLRARTGSPITSSEDFLAAPRIQNPPSPQPSGTTQSVTVSIAPDSSYYFAIKAIDKVLQSSEMVTIETRPVPNLTVTKSPFPNPTRDVARLEFVVEEEQNVRATLYDVLGRRVRTLFRDYVSSPFQPQVIESDLSSLSSGTYFLRLHGKSTARTERIVLVK